MAKYCTTKKFKTTTSFNGFLKKKSAHAVPDSGQWKEGKIYTRNKIIGEYEITSKGAVAKIYCDPIGK